MPYGTLTLNSKTYHPRSAGEYWDSLVTLQTPDDLIRIRGASIRKDKMLTFGSVYILEKDVNVGGDTVRTNMVCSVNIIMPTHGFTALDVRGGLNVLNDFSTEDRINRQSLGEI